MQIRMSNTAPVILVVDDDDSILNLVALCLERDGYKTLRARNGREALALWMRQRTEIDLVITDVDMPEMSGIEFASQLSRFQADVPILFVSGSFVSGGPFLSKPFDLRVLSQTVAGLMRPASQPTSAVS